MRKTAALAALIALAFGWITLVAMSGEPGAPAFPALHPAAAPVASPVDGPALLKAVATGPAPLAPMSAPPI